MSNYKFVFTYTKPVIFVVYGEGPDEDAAEESAWEQLDDVMADFTMDDDDFEVEGEELEDDE